MTALRPDRASSAVRATRRAVRLAAATAVSALALAACATPLPEADPEPVAAAVQPALATPEQAERILDDLAATLAAADEAADPAALEPRVTGPAARLREVQYRLAAAGDAEAVTPIPAGAQTLVVPATEEWPRPMMVVTEPPADLQPPLLLTLVQDAPRDPYRLWAWVRLFPGVEMPATAQPAAGVAVVPPDAEGLVAPPAEVTARYVDVLTSGAGSAHADLFAEDPLRAGIVATREAFTTVVGENGTLTETYAAGDETPWALATADGGAIVMGTFETVTTITLTDSALTLTDPVTAALAGTDAIDSTLTITWYSVVAFAVPPEGSGEPITVLGAEHTPTDATGE